jgi:hypothetical protein
MAPLVLEITPHDVNLAVGPFRYASNSANSANPVHFFTYFFWYSFYVESTAANPELSIVSP